MFARSLRATGSLASRRVQLRATKFNSWNPSPAFSRPYYWNSQSRVPLLVRIQNQVEIARRDHPYQLSFALFGAVSGLILLSFVAYDEYYVQHPKYANYPLEVEQSLRQALHYTHVKPNKEAALRHFQEALIRAEKNSLEPFSKEFIGLRIRYAEMLEKFGHVAAAIEQLDLLAVDHAKKIKDIDEVAAHDLSSPELRRRLLKGFIQFNIKISELYESDYLQDMDKAKQVLSDAVGVLVTETQNPQTKGFTEDNAAGMSFIEIASMLVQMGDLYAVTGQEAEAVQTYMLTLQPLRAACNGSRSCREAQVLSNIASTMAMAMSKPNAKINGKPATKESMVAARNATIKWADHALGAVAGTSVAERDSVCELAEISARMTKADLLLDGGDRSGAQEVLTGLIPKLKALGLNQLVTQAETGLARASP
jgi:hypothetical protein